MLETRMVLGFRCLQCLKHLHIHNNIHTEGSQVLTQNSFLFHIYLMHTAWRELHNAFSAFACRLWPSIWCQVWNCSSSTQKLLSFVAFGVFGLGMLDLYPSLRLILRISFNILYIICSKKISTGYENPPWWCAVFQMKDSVKEGLGESYTSWSVIQYMCTKVSHTEQHSHL